MNTSRFASQVTQTPTSRRTRSAARSRNDVSPPAQEEEVSQQSASIPPPPVERRGRIKRVIVVPLSQNVRTERPLNPFPVFDRNNNSLISPDSCQVPVGRGGGVSRRGMFSMLRRIHSVTPRSMLLGTPEGKKTALSFRGQVPAPLASQMNLSMRTQMHYARQQQQQQRRVSNVRYVAVNPETYVTVNPEASVAVGYPELPVQVINQIPIINPVQVPVNLGIVHHGYPEHCHQFKHILGNTYLIDAAKVQQANIVQQEPPVYSTGIHTINVPNHTPQVHQTDVTNAAYKASSAFSFWNLLPELNTDIVTEVPSTDGMVAGGEDPPLSLDPNQSETSGLGGEPVEPTETGASIADVTSTALLTTALGHHAFIEGISSFNDALAAVKQELDYIVQDNLFRNEAAIEGVDSYYIPPEDDDDITDLSSSDDAEEKPAVHVSEGKPVNGIVWVKNAPEGSTFNAVNAVNFILGLKNQLPKIVPIAEW